MKSWKKTIAVLGLAAALFVPFASARTVTQETAGGAQQDAAKAEADAYKAWYDANQAKDLAKAYPLAKEYVAKYPSGQYADYLKKWIVGTRGVFFNQAMQAKNTAEMMKWGNEALAENPEDLDYLYLLTFSIRSNELLANNFTNAAALADYTQRTMKLIEAGKVPTVVKADQFNKNQVLGLLHQNLAIIEAKNGNQDKALEHYNHAAALDPSNPTYQFSCGSIHQAKYVAAAQKFQALPEADRQNPEANPAAKAALDEVNREADAVIECWARFLAMTTDKPDWAKARGDVEKALAPLYQYRHPDSPDGLQKLIEQYRTNPPAASANAGASSNGQ